MEAVVLVGSGGGDGWCANETYICDRIWWCTWPHYALTSALFTMAWVATYFAVVWFVWPAWRRWVTRHPSKYPEEESPHFFAGYFYSTAASLLVAGATIGPSLTLLCSGDGFVQFARPTEVERHRGVDLVIRYIDYGARVAKVAHIFQCYVTADLLIGMYYKLLKPEMIAHHAVLVFFCVLLTYNCFGQLLAGMMLSMELSTVPLNYFLYFRNRLGDTHWTCLVSFGFFASFFLLLRVVGLSCMAFYFLYVIFFDASELAGVADWSLVLISIGLLITVVLQLFWAGSVCCKFKKFFENRHEEHLKTGHANSQDGLVQPLLT